jgi:hypothetical protein
LLHVHGFKLLGGNISTVKNITAALCGASERGGPEENLETPECVFVPQEQTAERLHNAKDW